ncbi:protein activator of alkane oxidation PraB [Caulobacter zeae]|uniref:Protein activator of alkane oxidation PraB n=1 Tax=Caulobacter zeae TaxID=2055137 RepID=A0A2N5DNG0_9CAUL|nr:protein activator of alkane oxidation PraB [Caulobacter zeae]PLR27589.1 protein activator of alkane oxidation PraB [Caulobacter zeae]
MLKSASVLAAAILATAGFAAAGSASAATITPAGTGFTLSGDLTMSQSTTVECAVTLTGTTASDGSSASITGGSFAAGDWQCGWLVTPSSFPWSVTLNGGSSITISGIGANSILGNCAGSITTNWSGGVTFSGATIPGSPGTCSITGTLTSSPSLTVS